MSVFRTRHFKVIPDGNGQFPIVTFDGEFYWWKGKALVTGKSVMQALRALETICTPKRPLGTKSMVVHVEAGPSLASGLEVPSKSGLLSGYSAFLTEMRDISVHAKGTAGGDADEQYECSLTFLITSDPIV